MYPWFVMVVKLQRGNVFSVYQKPFLVRFEAFPHKNSLILFTEFAYILSLSTICIIDYLK